MSNSTSRLVLSKPTTALLNSEAITIYHQSPIMPDANSVENAKLNIARSDKTPEYGICRWVEKSNDKWGARVVKFPDGFSGVSTELDDEEMESMGTLLKSGSRWVVETDLETVERIRREKEVARMKAGKLFIGGFGYDSERYLASLQAADKKAGRMVTRGHGGLTLRS